MRIAPFSFSSHHAALLILLVLVNISSAVDSVQLSNGHFDLEHDGTSGRISLRSKEGNPWLRNATAAAGLHTGDISAADVRYGRRHERSASSEPALPGEQLILFCTDSQKQLDMEYRITLLKNRAAAVFEVKLTNVSSDDLLIRHAEPLRAMLHEDAGCFFGVKDGKGGAMKALTNGYIYYDPGRLYDFGPQATQELDSFWNAAFHLSETGQTLVAGYLENRDAEGHVLADCKQPEGANGGGFSLTARSLYAQHFVLKPKATISSGRLLLSLSPDAFTGLEHFAETSGRLHDVKLNPIINGWSTWSGYYSNVTEQDVLKQAKFIARELKPYGMEWVQIDDGYQRAFGDWEGRSDKFPHGMKWLAGQIRELGLKPGLWIAPYAISASTDVAKNHPDWLLHDVNGKVQPIEQGHQGQAQNILDVTHPAARQWLSDLLRTITVDWGYDFIKTDFVEWTLLAAQRYHDPTASRARAYRLGTQAMRDAMGPTRHLLDCGPGPEVVGLIDSMRIELDRPIPESPLWEQYAGHHSSTGPAVAKRYYFHNRTWINDADHLRLAQLTVPQAQAAVTITGLSGGNMIAGDRLDELDPARLDMVKKVFPAFGVAARPLDLFETEAPAIFAHEVRKPFGRWWLVGYFNWGKEPVTRELDLARLGLDPRKTYLIYEFWSQRLLGEASQRVRLDLPSTSVQHLAIHENKGIPQVLSTDRHYTQGAVEFEGMTWDAASKTLSGVAFGKPGMSWTMAIHVPPPFRWAPADGSATGISNMAYEQPILRGQVRFDATDRTKWTVRFE